MYELKIEIANPIPPTSFGEVIELTHVTLILMGIDGLDFGFFIYTN
jgi:hypothetical protein